MKKKLITGVTAAMMLLTLSSPVAASAATDINNNIEASSKNYKKVTIEWDTVDSIDGYEIYKMSPSDDDYVLIDNVADLTETYVDTKVQQKTEYKYKLRPYKTIGMTTYYSDDNIQEVAVTTPKKPKPKIPQRVLSAKKIINTAETKIGCPYVWAAEGPSCFDCSGFVFWVFQNTNVPTVRTVPRTSCAGLYSTFSDCVVSYNAYSDAQPGDIILFGNGGHYFHTAIALGNGQMIHASSSRGIIIADINCISCSGTAVLRVLK